MAKTAPKERPDLGLEQALGDAKARAKKLPYGRVILVITKLDGVVASHRVEIDRLTEEDIASVMTAKPRKRGVHECR